MNRAEAQRALDAYCKSHGITHALREQAQLRLTDPDEAMSLLDWTNKRAAPPWSILIPFFDINRQPVHFYDERGERRLFFRLRALGDRMFAMADKAAKFVQPAKSGNHTYFPPNLDWREVVGNAERPVLVTEGEIKALVGSDALSMPCIAFTGVDGWCKGGAEGQRVAIEDLNSFSYSGRRFYITYDSDAAYKPRVLSAERALGKELFNRRARPYAVRLPTLPGESKTDLNDWVVHHRQRASAEFTKLLDKAESLGVPDGITAEALLNKKFPRQSWIVNDLLSPGLATLSGPPKIGKSWASLELVRAVATGQRAFGTYTTKQGDALYLSLEDDLRRLQDRLQITKCPSTPALHIHINWPTGDDGAERLLRWCEEHPNARLIVVDTLQKIRARATRGENAYQADYDALSAFKRVADRFGICVVLIHHTRKGDADDPFEKVSGSMGITGAADTNLLLERARGTEDALLRITGREVRERELAMRFDVEACRWRVLGPANQHFMSQQRQALLVALRRADRPLTLQEVAELVSDASERPMSRPNARKMLRAIIDDGLVQQGEDRRYSLVERTDAERAERVQQKISKGRL